MVRVDIKPACLRDASYVVAHMRPEDEAEVLCQLKPDVIGYEIAYSLVFSGDAFIACWDDVPTMLFGAHPLNVCTLSVWAIGTRKTWRVLPEVTRFMVEHYLPAKIDDGFFAMEARSLVGHEAAHRWMESTGAVACGPPFVYGRDREMFLMFRWTADRIGEAAERYRRRSRA